MKNNQVYETNGRYEVAEVMEALNNFYSSGSKEKTIFLKDGLRIKSRSARYKTFHYCGTTCVHCGRKGAHFLKQKHKGTNNPYHINLYSEDEVLLGKQRRMDGSFITLCDKCK